MGLAVANAAKHKLVGVPEKLKGEGMYVSEVVVLGKVKGTPFDDAKRQSSRRRSPTSSGSSINPAERSRRRSSEGLRPGHELFASSVTVRERVPGNRATLRAAHEA
jgi:hypothetical protein